MKRIHKALDGLGYLPPYTKSKNLRDTELGVRIEFLVFGEYPGDGLAKPVCFPEPFSASVDLEGIRYLNLEQLIQLKLASGMTAAGRMKDLADVIELIKILNLPREFSSKLDPFVREKYQELWKSARRRFLMYWRNKWLTSQARTIDDMIESLRGAADELERMRADGVSLDPNGGTTDDYAQLVTSDPEIAKKYGFEDESEFWGDDEDGVDGGDDPEDFDPN